MKSRVLYFPYIRVPENVWLTQMLLYWDQVSSIVPYDYIENPESLGPYMLDLVREELVYQVMPGAYIYDIPRFSENFLRYLNDLGAVLDRRRAAFAQNSCRIHIEKMGPLGDALVALKIAQADQYPWYNVESATADDFMCYLATTLGQIESIDSSPVTASGEYLQRLVLAGVPDDHVERQLATLRVQVLEKVLPIPTRAIEAPRIRAFRDKHAQELRDFRLRVERELVTAAGIVDPALRQRHLSIFFDEAEVRIEEIQGSMRSAGWETARAAFSVVAAIPGVSPALGLLAAIADAFTGKAESRGHGDFAYAAQAYAEFAV